MGNATDLEIELATRLCVGGWPSCFILLLLLLYLLMGFKKLRNGIVKFWGYISIPKISSQEINTQR
jgi:hypothetical protein